MSNFISRRDKHYGENLKQKRAWTMNEELFKMFREGIYKEMTFEQRDQNKAE